TSSSHVVVGLFLSLSLIQLHVEVQNDLVGIPSTAQQLDRGLIGDLGGGDHDVALDTGQEDILTSVFQVHSVVLAVDGQSYLIAEVLRQSLAALDVDLHVLISSPGSGSGGDVQG